MAAGVAIFLQARQKRAILDVNFILGLIIKSKNQKIGDFIKMINKPGTSLAIRKYGCYNLILFCALPKKWNKQYPTHKTTSLIVPKSQKFKIESLQFSKKCECQHPSLKKVRVQQHQSTQASAGVMVLNRVVHF